jgi:hypothetical protein
LTTEEFCMRKTMWNCGIPAALAALALAGCLNPAAPPAAKAAEADAAFAVGQREPYTAAVSLGGPDADARSVAGPTKERISLTGIRNFIQLIAVDKADGTIAGFYEERGSGACASATLMLKGLATGRTYGILLLQGHWERDYAKETVGNYVYTAGPPVLLSAGYTEVTFSGGGSAAIGVWPIYVDTAFTAGGISAEPVVLAGKPGAVSLPAGDWAANWKILRGASGTASGLGDLVRAQKAAGFPGESFIATGKKAVVWTAAQSAASAAYAPAPDTLDSLTLTGHTVTLPLADYTGLSQTGKAGAVNFALSFIPFNLTSGWAAHDAASVFDLASGPPEWIIRNGINARPQDDKTNFAGFGYKPVETANGNGALRFAVEPSLPASGKLAVSNGSYTEPFVIFTTSGYTGTAQAWYAAVPAAAAAPAYDAYLPLGDLGPGAHSKPVTLPGTGEAVYHIYVVLLKDGRAGAPHKIIRVGKDGLLTSAAAVRDYLAANDPRGGSAANPLPLPVKMHLSGANSLENLFAAIGGAGKYVDLDLSRCTMDGTAFNPGGSGTGKGLVVSLFLPDGARSIGNQFASLRTVRGNGVTGIGQFAFAECSSLTTVNLPAATNIGQFAFAYCPSLTTVNLPAATNIGGAAFVDCPSLTTVNLPAAASLGDMVFSGAGTKALTVTLGRNAPALTGNPPGAIKTTKTVIIRRPASNTGYDAAWQNTFKKSFGKNAVITLVFQDS